jgi:phosphatidylinositol-4,5-bisphosphate 3-kinase
MRQNNALEKLKQGSELVKKGSKEKGTQRLMDFLKSQHVVADLSNVVSPLNPSLKCKTVKIDKVKVMDSKMRPIYSVFENVDAHGQDIHIIFKNGGFFWREI